MMLTDVTSKPPRYRDHKGGHAPPVVATAEGRRITHATCDRWMQSPLDIALFWGYSEVCR